MKHPILFILFLHVLFPCSLLPQQPRDTVEHSTFLNPIFPGDYPDPSILVEGDNFYVVHSSFEYYPGLTIWHSKDLLHWTPVTSALKKYVGSVWAPDLVKYNSKYYIYFPANNTNYVVVADSIGGPWSDPIDLRVGNIDPGHVVDEHGNRYLYFSSGGYVPLSKDGVTVTGPLTHVYDGWQIPREWSIECFCMESPKLFKRGAYYYLTVAQGGTAGPPTGHMVISARSRSPFGPWENSPFNPILRAQSGNERWVSVGHATIFEASPNNWWMIFHGYERNYYTMGRQTLLAPIEWTDDGWFKVPETFKLDTPIKKPLPSVPSTPVSLSDAFEGRTLKPQWKFFGEYDTNRFVIANNSLVLRAKGSSVGDCAPLLCIPAHHSYTAEVEVTIKGAAIGGLVLFYSPKAYSGILADSVNILANLRGWQFPTEKNVINRRVLLRLKNINGIVDMYYSLDGAQWKKIENSTDVSAYHHNVLSDFLSLRIGLVAIGSGSITFKNFRYTPIL